MPVTIGSGLPVLPLSLTVGAWLLRCCGLRAAPAGAAAASRPRPLAPAVAQQPRSLARPAVAEAAAGDVPGRAAAGGRAGHAPGGLLRLGEQSAAGGAPGGHPGHGRRVSQEGDRGARRA